MAQRGITEQEIDEALANPDTTYPSAKNPGRMVVLGRTIGPPARRLKVVVTVDDPQFVVTVADRDDEVG